MEFNGKCPNCGCYLVDMDTPDIFEEVEIDCECGDCGYFFIISAKYESFIVKERVRCL